MARTVISIPADEIADTHVESSRAMITEAAALTRAGRAAILGCGACRDIPLLSLGRTFDHIDLVDLDAQALQSAESLYRSWSDTTASCEFHHAELTGLLSRITPAARAIAAQASDPKACIDQLGCLLTSTEPHFWMPRDGQKYDLVICSAILTQLEIPTRQQAWNSYLHRFPGERLTDASRNSWNKYSWDFARQLENAFLDHLTSLVSPSGLVFLSATVHVCWLSQSDPETFESDGSWIATRTSLLTDYLQPVDEILKTNRWTWIKRQREGAFWGRLYGVQAVLYRPGKALVGNAPSGVGVSASK
jgi:hypothetical protein